MLVIGKLKKQIFKFHCGMYLYIKFTSLLDKLCQNLDDDLKFLIMALPYIYCIYVVTKLNQLFAHNKH